MELCWVTCLCPSGFPLRVDLDWTALYLGLSVAVHFFSVSVMHPLKINHIGSIVIVLKLLYLFVLKPAPLLLAAWA